MEKEPSVPDGPTLAMAVGHHCGMVDLCNRVPWSGTGQSQGMADVENMQDDPKFFVMT